MFDELKKVFQRKSFQSKSRDVFRIQLNICDGGFFENS